MSNFISAVRGFIADENGVTALEYGMIAALIAAVITVGVKAMGISLNTLFVTLETTIVG